MVNLPPLNGLKVLEFAGLAPGPFAGMLLADAGASVLRIDRAPSGKTQQSPPAPTEDMLARRKSSIAVNLKSARGVALIKRLIPTVDVLIDPFRPGVLEKLGLGPDVLLALHPGLIYARMTGFRRDGRYAMMAGHDINYLAVSGVLGMLGRDGEKPHPPWNILADFAGGGAMLVQGILLALFARHASGRGQVVEANMVDGSSYLATFPRMALKTSLGDKGRGRNMLDGGCPWYDTYETRDGKYMSVGALEPHFFALLLRGLGLTGQGWEENRGDESRWPELRRLFTGTFKKKTGKEWEAVFDGTDACCAPVLEYPELEQEPGREGDQRPAVALGVTPLLALKTAAGGVDSRVAGQGEGVEGEGYIGVAIPPGHGGEDTLKEWCGWKQGREFDVEGGGLVLRDQAKL